MFTTGETQPKRLVVNIRNGQGHEEESKTPENEEATEVIRFRDHVYVLRLISS